MDVEPPRFGQAGELRPRVEGDADEEPPSADVQAVAIHVALIAWRAEVNAKPVLHGSTSATMPNTCRVQPLTWPLLLLIWNSSPRMAVTRWSM
jgi:hypothetical protein